MIKGEGCPQNLISNKSDITVIEINLKIEEALLFFVLHWLYALIDPNLSL